MHAQVYQDHFGTGNTSGVKMSSSATDGDNPPENILNGTGYFPDMAGASRFLGQASLGASYEEITAITEIGIEQWIDQQIELPYTLYLDKYYEINQEITQLIQTVHPGEEIENQGEFTSFIFYNSAFRDQDVLRNKVAYAMLQILVVSRASIVLGGQVKGHTSYYDILYDQAFGNFRDILTDVTLHPMMGYYLSHLQNKKGDPELGTLPDENYAREIMQLFTIGLHELNIDGTYRLDENGERIPTYDITDIQELAKVFTGLSGGAWNLDDFPQFEGQPLAFNRDLRQYDIRVPMIMYEEFHEPGEKIMIDGSVISAGQSGMDDINMALDVLFNHPNVGPFLARRLIQQMVKSNPTPGYIKRVAKAFNDNGEGVRGDMGAVIRAILLDTEARDCIWLEDAKNGRLKQPMERIINLCRAFDIDSESGRLWFHDRDLIAEQLGQAFMSSPTVFNFFTPFYAEDKYVEPNEMVSPEFQILHAVTAINYYNYIEDGLRNGPFRNRTRVNNNNPRLAYNNGDAPFLDLTDEVALLESDGISAMLERLNLILCHGSMSEGTKGIIQSALEQYQNTGAFTDQNIVEAAIYFIMVSPDYAILE